MSLYTYPASEYGSRAAALEAAKVNARYLRSVGFNVTLSATRSGYALTTHAPRARSPRRRRQRRIFGFSW